MVLKLPVFDQSFDAARIVIKTVTNADQNSEWTITLANFGPCAVAPWTLYTEAKESWA